MVFIPTTPNSTLQRAFQEEKRKSRFKIRVDETSGRSLKQILQRSNPFKERQCSRDQCPVCTTGGKGSCDMKGVNYEIQCECGGKYIGQSSRSSYERGREHFNQLRNEKGVLWKHQSEEHGGDSRKFTMKTTEQFGDDSMLRQISEAVRVHHERPTMNSKDEWNYVVIPRASVMSGNDHR